MKDPRDVEDPRNDEDYDTFDYGTEPLPKDKTWAACKKTPDCPYTASEPG